MEVLRRFQDRNGVTFDLWARVWQHIREGHPEVRSVEWLEKVLSDPDVIVQSNWSESAQLYYRRRGKYFRVVVVDVEESRVKTAYVTDSIKSGERLWTKR